MKRITPALSLKNIINSIRRLNKPKTRLFDAISLVLETEGQGIHGIDAYYLISDLFNRTEKLIDNLNLDAESKKKMFSDLIRIKNCFEIPTVASPLEGLLKGQLNESAEGALEYIHIAIVQNHYFEFDPIEAEEVGQVFREALNKVEESSLPHEVSEIISIRLKQVISACQRFGLYGPNGLDAALAELSGEVLIQKIKLGGKDEAGVFSRVLKHVPTALNFADRTSRSANSFENLIDKGKSVIEAVIGSNGG